MNAADLTTEVRVLHERITSLQHQFDRQEKALDEFRKSLDQLNTAVAKLQQKLDDHIAHAEKWDTRRWALLAAIVGGLAVNIVMLFINRK